MKFENIKIGDIIYIEEPVEYGWGNIRYFWIPVPVSKVTKTQFVAGGYRFQKESGKMIGGNRYSAYAKNLGDKCYMFPSDVVTDQTTEMKEFKYKMKIIQKIKSDISELKIPYGDNFSIDELSQIQTNIDAIIQIISSKK